MDYRNKAFTIIELLIIIVIVGILTSVIIVSFSNISQRTVIASLQSDLVNAKKQIQNFQTTNGSYPSDINCANPTSTQICITASSGNVFENYVSYPIGASNRTSYYLTAKRSGTTTVYHTTEISPILAVSSPISDGLSFNLDAGNTSSYPGSGTTWNDITGNLATPTLAGGFSSTNKSITFNGTDARLVRALLPNSMQTFTSSTNRTWEMMVKLNNTTSIVELFGLKASQGCTYYCNGGFLSWNGVIRFTWYDNSSYKYLISGISFNGSNFYHIVATMDGSDRRPRIFVNGVIRDTFTTSTNMDYGNLWNGLGYEAAYDSRTTPDGTISYLNGEIGYIKYYHNKALSESEVWLNYNATKANYGL